MSEAKRHPSARSGGLGARIFLWILALTIIPVAIVAYQGYHCANQALVDSVRREMEKTALAYARQLEAWIREREDDLVFLAGLRQVRDRLAGTTADAEEAGRESVAGSSGLLEKLVEAQVAFQNIVLFDENWNVLAAARSGTHGAVDFRLSTIMQRVSRKGGPAVSCLHLHGDRGVGVHVGVPVESPGSGSPGGYLLAALDLSHLLGPLLTTKEGLGTSGKVYLIDGGKYVIAASWPLDAASKEQAIIGREAARAGIEEAHGAGEYIDLRGHAVVGGYARIAEMGGTLVVELDRSEALEWVGILALRASLVGLATVLAVAAFSGRIARGLARPMRILARVAQRIRDGERLARVPELEGREAAAVGRALNEMLDELEETHRRLVHAATLAAVGEFSSSVVHEIRNPLSSIKLNLQALEKFAEGDETHAELAAIAKEQSLRIERMLGDLLAYSRPLEMEFQETSLAGVLEQAVREVRSAATERGVTLRSEWPEEPIRAPVDPSRLAQAVVNLLRNAIQAVARGGEVEMRLARRPGPKPVAVFDVRDIGPGLAEENMDRLFRPFFTTRDDGTGLGLANAKKIIEYHGGTVEGHNRQDGPGAVFTVTLPLRRMAP